MSTISFPLFGARTPSPSGLKRRRSSTPIEQKGEPSSSTQPPAQRVKQDVVIKKEESPSPEPRRVSSLDNLKAAVRNFGSQFALDKNAIKKDEAKNLQNQLRTHMNKHSLEDMNFKPEIAQQAMNAASDAARNAGKPRSAESAADRMRTIFSRAPY